MPRRPRAIFPASSPPPAERFGPGSSLRLSFHQRSHRALHRRYLPAQGEAPPVSDNACGVDVPVQDQAAVHALEDPVGQTEIIPCLSGQVCADAVAGSKSTPAPEGEATRPQVSASNRMHGRGPGHDFRAQCWDCGEVSQLIVLQAMSPLAAHSADSHRTLSARPAGVAGGGCPFGDGRFRKFDLRACMGRPGGVVFSKSPAGCVGGAAGGLKTLIF